MSIERFKAFLRGYLPPESSLLEVVVGIIIVLGTANTVGVTVSRDDSGTSAILAAAFGVTIAWGIVDACLQLLTTLYHRAFEEQIVERVHQTDDPQVAVAAIAEAVDSELANLPGAERRDAFFLQIAEAARSNPPPKPRISRYDLLGALLTFLLMVGTTLPLSVPLFFLDDPQRAVVVSNVIAIVCLFIIGYYWAAYTTIGRVKFGLVLASIGLALTLMTIWLGG